MKHILRYFYSLLLLLSFSGFSQEKKAADTIAPPVKSDRYGLRLGIDLHRLTRSFYDDGFRALEIVGDYRLTKKFYAAAELGNVDYTVNDAQLNFTTKGNYLKVGFDYNAYDNWLDMENMIYVGFRYGFASFSQNLNSYKTYESSGYFDEVTVYPDTKYSGLTAHWIEVVGGLKAEVFDNIYIGFSFRLNNLLTDKKPVDFDNLYIPGFNRTYSGKFGVGFNYTVSYFIPLYKKQGVPKEKK
ncbi:hypothetical protein HYN59_14510 [Flavobacterium album]|uniref:Outer membrane protein beta-barrel domain-containing protein n=1 Tax=Flavobacterium album TaxID=2175091 RepID=A0A2S1R0U1_9FLAO|nr:DUF6048 family protein [Flavobacterium album]AWH86247.1 hypothetical protein HYN59_14510 [Flavobacterium album]